MTDHLITRSIEGKTLLAPLEESTPIITDLELFQKEKLPKDVDSEVYRVITVIRQSPTTNHVDYLYKLLEKSPSKLVTPYSDLATGLLKTRQYQKAIDILTKHLIPINYPGAEEQLSTIYLLLNQTDRAISLLEKITVSSPLSTSAWYNLGLAYGKNKQYSKAENSLKETTRQNPYLDKAWYYLGLVYIEQHKPMMAISTFKRALEINPNLPKAYLELVKALIEVDDIKEAKRYLLHGRKVSSDKSLLNLPSFNKLNVY